VGRSAFFSGTIFTQLFVDKGGFPILGRNGEPFAAREPELAGGREG
jgi:hypothetical protein